MRLSVLRVSLITIGYNFWSIKPADTQITLKYLNYFNIITFYYIYVYLLFSFFLSLFDTFPKIEHSMTRKFNVQRNLTKNCIDNTLHIFLE